MSRERFDPDNTLAGGLYGMTAKEAVALAIGLCEAVEQSVGADGVHGCVWPGNITAVNGGVAVGVVPRKGERGRRIARSVHGRGKPCQDERKADEKGCRLHVERQRKTRPRDGGLVFRNESRRELCD